MVKLAAVLLSAVFAAPVLGGTREMTFADGYNGGSWVESVEQTISFSTKDDQEIAFNGGLPKYYNVSSYTNTCANVAGTTVLGYYDQYYDNLIENFTSATIIFGYTIYNTQTDAVQAVINQLYIDMDTNVTEGGTTINGFKNGMVTYVARKNRQLTYSQIVSGSAVALAVELGDTSFLGAMGEKYRSFGKPWSLFPNIRWFLRAILKRRRAPRTYLCSTTAAITRWWYTAFAQLSITVRRGRWCGSSIF